MLQIKFILTGHINDSYILTLIFQPVHENRKLKYIIPNQIGEIIGYY